MRRLICTIPALVFAISTQGVLLAQQDSSAPASRPAATATRPAVPRPIVELLFNEKRGDTTANSGSSSDKFPTATLTRPFPLFSTNAPPNGGPGSIDFGRQGDISAVDISSPAEYLAGLKSITITGWVNCRDKENNQGNIVNWMKAAGAKIALQYNGRLELKVNGEGRSTTSNDNKMTFDFDVGEDNWRFFAVTYDSTLESDNVRFYFGTAKEKATLDRSGYFQAGPVGGDVASHLSIGNLPPDERPRSNRQQMFRGLIDDIRIFGSGADGSGALTPEQIIEVQNISGGANATQQKASEKPAD